MGLQDFLKKLEEQDDKKITYSKPSNEKQQQINKQEVKQVETKQVETKKVEVKKVEDTKQVKEKEPQVVVQPPKELSGFSFSFNKYAQELADKEKQRIADELFIQSDTREQFRELWMDYYFLALDSTKNNAISNSMKLGKFRIISEDKNKGIVLLPKYDYYNKSVNEILKDKWLDS